MVLKIINHECEYDMRKLCTLFFPYEKIVSQGESSIVIITEKRDSTLSVSASIFGKSLKNEYSLKAGEDVAYAMSVLLYKTLCAILGYEMPWGILFGVRPAKLMHRLADSLGEEGARDYFIDRFLVSPDKAELALQVMKHENRVISLSQGNSFSLYVSIPFCPTRCSYCSFVSHSVEKTQKLIESYVDLLCRELEKTGRLSKELGLRLETVYFGGGTPTTLSAKQLEKLFACIEKSFDLSTLREYTVEAGRPDTVTREKLIAMRSYGVSRISINPQTFNQNVLDAIGRRHMVEQTYSAFELARKCGFDNINMDLIAGLPHDTAESFMHSADEAVRLGAESITVHTLALKSAAYLVTEDTVFSHTDRLQAEQMVNYSQNLLADSGYYPYYMYRQSKTAANFENVGWCKEGRDCLYNVYMMDETHSVLAAGAGAVTRLKNQDTCNIERIYNYKYPYEYIDNFEEVLLRRDKIKSFQSNK